MKNKWLDAPTEEGFWWRKLTMDDQVSMTFVEIRKNNPTFPIFVYDMNCRKKEFEELPYIQWQKVKNPDEN